MNKTSLLAFVAACALATNGVSEEFGPCLVKGHTGANAWVVANTGEITQADDAGNFELKLPVQGVYCIKAMKDGYADVMRPWLVVPTAARLEIPMWAYKDPNRRVVHGNIGHPAQLIVTDSGNPIRGFDLAGVEVEVVQPHPVRNRNQGRLAALGALYLQPRATIVDDEILAAMGTVEDDVGVADVRLVDVAPYLNRFLNLLFCHGSPPKLP